MLTVLSRIDAHNIYSNRIAWSCSVPETPRAVGIRLDENPRIASSALHSWQLGLQQLHKELENWVISASHRQQNRHGQLTARTAAAAQRIESFLQVMGNRNQDKQLTAETAAAAQIIESVLQVIDNIVGNLSPVMGPRNQVGIGLSYRPASLCSLATQFQTQFLEPIPRPIAGLKFATQEPTWAADSWGS
jgi:hypothetical protein